ncbi:hypothetical protein [Halosegnis sp.]|uniref:hypothetical protein n=1 Tax=Halosegnis sp. TaxID=2864959 RepID=UPI0035D48E09
MSDGDPNREARERQHERAAAVERVLTAVERGVDAYPANSDELAAQYRAAEVDVVNETESLADAFDRLADEYDEFADPEEARAALTAELRRDERFDETFTDAPE